MRTVVLLFADRERFADQRAFLQSFGDLKDSSEVAQLHATLKVKRKTAFLERRAITLPSNNSRLTPDDARDGVWQNAIDARDDERHE